MNAKAGTKGFRIILTVKDDETQAPVPESTKGDFELWLRRPDSSSAVAHTDFIVTGPGVLDITMDLISGGPHSLTVLVKRGAIGEYPASEFRWQVDGKAY